jgi:glucokinase
MSDVVVADIGGTHARLALIAAHGVRAVRHYPSAAFENGAALVARYLEDLELTGAAGCCVAIAGPVADGTGRLTNGRMACDERSLAQVAGSTRVCVINDFTAVGHAVPQLDAGELRAIGPNLHGDGTKAAIGPGTGLGMGIVVPDRGGWRVLPSEGGHAALAPADPLEAEVLAVLQRHYDFVGWETVLCGPGLVNLYRAVCEVWGCPAELTDAREVTAKAISIDEPVCHQTLEMFCNLLGSAAGDLALTVCATGGIYLAGGILPQMADFLCASGFRRRFEMRGPLTWYVESIPTWLVLETALGLLGAAAAYRAVYGALP